MQPVQQIKVGKHKTGIVGLEETLKDLAKAGANLSDHEIASEMMKRLSKKNYIAPGTDGIYEKAFIREYKKYVGEPVPQEPLEEIEIKVLGAGCPNCDKLEMTLMALIEKMAIKVDLEHVRDMKEIAAYGVMGSPALVINRKVKAAGSVPSKSKLERLLLAASAEIDAQKGV